MNIDLLGLAVVKSRAMVKLGNRLLAIVDASLRDRFPRMFIFCREDGQDVRLGYAVQNSGLIDSLILLGRCNRIVELIRRDGCILIS